MNNYIPIKKKRNRRSNPDTIIMAARPSGGGKNKIRIRVTIPKKLLVKYFGRPPTHARLEYDRCIQRFRLYDSMLSPDGIGRNSKFLLTKSSTNLYTFWINVKEGLRYFYDIDYAESTYIINDSPGIISFDIKEVKHAE